MPDQEPPTPGASPPTQVQVQIPEQRFEILYSDQAFVSHSPVGFTLDFAQLTPQMATSRVVARVGMSAAHLKLLVHVLSENLERYEQQFGSVPITPQMVQQHNLPTHHIGFQPGRPPGAEIPEVESPPAPGGGATPPP